MTSNTITLPCETIARVTYSWNRIKTSHISEEEIGEIIYKRYVTVATTRASSDRFFVNSVLTLVIHF